MVSLFDALAYALLDLPPLALLVAVFIFSALVGSFLNVVIYRLPIILERDWQAQAREILGIAPVAVEKFNLVVPRSQCRDCGRMVQGIENIPIISYLAIRGKCRGCGARISAFYPFVELSTAVIATFVFWHLGANAAGFFALFFVFTLVALTGIDLKVKLLPDIITIPLMWAGIILAIWSVYIPLETAVIGALLGYLSLWGVATGFKLLTGRDGMGLGDAKLLAAIFTWVHFQYFALVLIIACFSGITVALLQKAFDRSNNPDNLIPFGPHLALGGLIAFLYGAPIVDWYVGFLTGY